MDMINYSNITEEKFKNEICPRCEIKHDLKCKENLLTRIFDDYHDSEVISRETQLKYDIGNEGVKELKKNKCNYVEFCEEIDELVKGIMDLEDRLSKLLYYLMNNNQEKEVYYISSSITPYYPLLANRIIRSKKKKSGSLDDIITLKIENSKKDI